MHTYSEAVLSCNDIGLIVEQNNIQDGSSLLIQLFSARTDISAIKKFQTFFQSKFPLATLIGCTSDGVISGANVYPKDKSVVSFTIFEATNLSSYFIAHDEKEYDAFQSGRRIATRLISENTKLLITFTDGIYTNGEEYIQGISSINENIIVAGGMAGDNGMLVRTYVFDKYNITSSGAVAVAFESESLQVVTDYNFDWTPIGKKLLVTKAIKNRVYEIDGMSAVELYTKYLGEELTRYLPQIGIEFPLILERDGVLIGRAVLFKHDDGSLTFAGNIHEEEIVRFGVGNVETILRSGNYNLRNLFKKSIYQPETFFIYSCMARQRFIGSLIEREMKKFAEIAPTAGFFTYGEFYHDNGKNQLLNETMTVLSLSESKVPTSVVIDNALVYDKYFSVNPLHIISHLTNVVSSELEEINDMLESRIKESTGYIYNQVYSDKLTQLPNRLKLIKELPNHTGRILLLINIDDFTLVNDFYGHIVGDYVLKNIASVIKKCASSEDAIAFKLPSDEFVLILQKNNEKKIIEQIIERLIFVIKNTNINYNGFIININVTISAAVINKEGTGLINADMALKLAKQANKSFLFFDESLMLIKHYEKNVKMAGALRNAIQTDNIIPYFQAIYDLNTGNIEKYESLVRLRQEDGEILLPATFLEIAQKIKLYSQITKIMIEKTFSFFKKNGLHFTVNLSFEDIVHQETRDFIFEKIKQFDIAKQLTFEILETQQIENEYLVQKFIQEVYACGAKIAIDDFGSGFANFEHMTRMRASYIKIDGSLIKNIDTDNNARLVVETIIAFAQKLNMKTVAEFVHSKEILEIVRELKVDFAQGYYLNMPSADATCQVPLFSQEMYT
ncbi:EAL domain-containing protein [bacterium]|nr:EAL domain-containing protein [bacterium]MBU1994138.1 EAL domain-containing protein [bacterium]